MKINKDVYMFRAPLLTRFSKYVWEASSGVEFISYSFNRPLGQKNRFKSWSSWTTIKSNLILPRIVTYELCRAGLPFLVLSNRDASSRNITYWLAIISFTRRPLSTLPGRIRRRRCSARRLPLRPRTPTPRLRHGRHGQQGRLRRRRGPVQERSVEGWKEKGRKENTEGINDNNNNNNKRKTKGERKKKGIRQ